MREYIEREALYKTVAKNVEVFDGAGSVVKGQCLEHILIADSADVVEIRDCEKCKFFSRTSTEYPCSHCRNCYIDQFKPKEGETK